MRTPRRNGVPADRPRHSATAAGPAGSHRWFPGGAGGPPRESAESRMGGLTVRGPTVRLLVGDLAISPSPPPCSLPKPSLALPSPCFARARRCSLPQALLARRAHPASARARPLSGFCPEPVLCAQSPPLSWLSSALRACALAGRKRAFACGVPGALRGTWVSPTRFDEMNDPCPRNVLI